MFKKLLSMALVLVMVFSLTVAFAGCSKSEADGIKIGVILIGDENEGYTEAHITGIKTAAKKLGIADSQILWKYTIGENEACYDAAADLVNKGCTLVVSNSYGHQTYMELIAAEYPEVSFVAMTGDTAAKSGLSNFSNAFTKVFESRYISGVVAGMKIAELIKDGKLTKANYDADGNVKVGYVGAYPYHEVVSGYTAFYLGIKSVVKNVAMEVQYTNSWFDLTGEAEAANLLIADGCVIIGQHADSTGAPSATQAKHEEGTVCYSVGYNIDMLKVAPDVALTSATNNWSVYYEYAFKAHMNDEAIVTDWAQGYANDAVAITALGPACASGTQEAVDAAVASIKNGELHVFDCADWTVNGETLTSYDKVSYFEGNEMIWDGYFHESELRAAPAFDIRIDGIIELNNN